MAHRGGAKHPDLVGIENTLQAFEHAVRLGFNYLETDTHSSADGTLFAFHDDTLERVTGHSGRIGDLSTNQLQEIQIAGQHAIPKLDDLLEAFPDSRMNIDLKDDHAVEPLVRLIARHQAKDRVCVGSFSHRRLIRFRQATSGRVATSASPLEVAAFLTLPSGVLKRARVGQRFQALQVPVKQGAVTVVNRSLVSRAHRLGVHVHVWTVDDRDEMQHLLALGVDGLITDRTDVLKNVLSHKGLWKGNP
ncbi:MAG TPA: glycerophosphodiester phosphodiesterase [Marmoricola sp.]|nr:glycerophosphodiester phosphodiesterase [Marmoricola sp.]